MSQLSDPSAYLRTKVLTASREELRLLLLDGALKFLRQGRQGMVDKDYEACFTGITKCRNIILELINTSKPDPDRDLYNKITALYTFMYTHLVEANFERNVTKVDTVINLLEFERETWVMLMDKLRQEKTSQTAVEMKEAAQIMPGDAVLAAAAPANYRPLSLQG